MTSTHLIRGSFGEDVAIGGHTCVRTARGDRGVVMYGPYEERAPGRWRVEFSVGLADGSLPVENPICVSIDVVANEGNTLIVERRILFSELSRGLTSFDLTFTLHEARKLEYRIHSNAQVSLLVARDVLVGSVAEAETPASPRGSRERQWEYEREFLDGYLRNISGLIHVGANHGQERRYYWLLGLEVLWIEPIDEVYEILVDNIAKYPRQRAIRALLTDKDGDEIQFQIASNDGASSSILPLEGHTEIYPDVRYVETRKIVSSTLASLVREGKVDLSRYQALSIDTEGAEMMVLNGARAILDHFEYIKCEASDFQSRSGNPTAAQLDAIMREAGFAQIGRRDFGMGPDYVGTNWDIVWKKVRPGEPLNEPGCTLPIIFDPTEVHGIEKQG